jgi:L-cysteine desulfidase
MQPMKRAMFTVHVGRADGRTDAYCANNLTVYDGQGGAQALAFICSGRLTTVRVADVVKVELSDGWPHCVACDGQVSHLSYGEEPSKSQA